jgi:hypothetical protein
MNPVNNGLQYPLIRDRQRGFTKPIGRMNLTSTARPIGRMGLPSSTQFSGFASSLPARSSGWVRFTSVGNSGILPSRSSGWVRPEPTSPQIKQMLGKIGFASSLPARGTTWQGKGWS